MLAAALAAGCNGKRGGTGGTGRNGGTGRTNRRVVTARAFSFVPPPSEPKAPVVSLGAAAALFKVARLDPLQARDLGTMRKVLKLPDRLFEKDSSGVIVTLHLPGKAEPLTGSAYTNILAFSTAGAVRNALGKRDSKLLETAKVRIDLMYGFNPCEPNARMIPGVEGLASLNEGKVIPLPPDAYLGDRPDVTQYILRLERLAGLPSGTWRKGKMLLGKYRGVSMLQLAPGDDPVFLYRGNALIATPTAEQSLAAAERGFAWLQRAQKADGSFRYCYYPYADRYSTSKYNIVRHAGTAFSLFGHLRLTGTEGGAAAAASFRAGERALDYLKTVAVEDKRFRFTYVPDGKRIKLGAAALALVALCERERAGGDDSNRKLMSSLARFILNQQTPEGEFLSHYDAVKGKPIKKFVSLYYPGEALLGLLRLYKLTGKTDKELLASCHRGAAYLIKFERRQAMDNLEKRVKAGEIYPPDAWFMQALEELIEVDPKPDYARHLFNLADCMTAGQFTAVGGKKPAWGEATMFPDLLGAIDESDPPSACATGARCEGLVSALRVARKLKKKSNARIYAKALGLSARFVAQNQYHAHNAYPLASPAKAMGGFRLGPLNCSIRIDYVQHCSAFLLEWSKLQEEPAPGGR
jgi:hypothetical protein